MRQAATIVTEEGKRLRVVLLPPVGSQRGGAADGIPQTIGLSQQVLMTALHLQVAQSARTLGRRAEDGWAFFIPRPLVNASEELRLLRAGLAEKRLELPGGVVPVMLETAVEIFRRAEQEGNDVLIGAEYAGESFTLRVLRQEDKTQNTDRE